MNNITYTEANRYSDGIFSHLEKKSNDWPSRAVFKRVVVIGAGKTTGSKGETTQAMPRCPQIEEIASTMRSHQVNDAIFKLIEKDDQAHHHAKAAISRYETKHFALDTASQSPRDLTNPHDRQQALGTNNSLIIMTQVLHHATRCYSHKQMSDAQRLLIKQIMGDVFASMHEKSAVYMDALSFLLIKKAFDGEENIKNVIAENPDAVSMETLTRPGYAPFNAITKGHNPAAPTQALNERSLPAAQSHAK